MSDSMRRGTMTLGEAIALATGAHAGVLDKSGVPYIEHPLRVMARVSGQLTKMAAVLHDVVEDTAVTLDDLRRLGCPERVVLAVDALSVRPDEDRDDYYVRIAASPIALQVKYADIADNSDERRLAALPAADSDRLRAKYRHALDVLGQLSGRERGVATG